MSKKTSSLEKGQIYFFYRPRVEEEDPQGKSDLQRLYMVLSPQGRKKFRLAVIGRKRMPDPGRSGRGRDWGFVDMVRDKASAIQDELGAENYTTKTRGERHLPAARPLGEGVYRIVRHEDHTHLVYALELPRKPGEVQDELNIEKEASYIISIKNPEKGSPKSVGLSKGQKADYPKQLQAQFRDRRFGDADPPSYLDHEGTEFILISAAEDVQEDLGLTLHPQKEDAHSADVFKELKIDRREMPTQPLFEGHWE